MGDENLTQRLASERYDRQDIVQSLRGEKLPEHLGYPLSKLSTIHGIRHFPSFAEGEAAVLHGLPEHPEFTRALNARAIMSNRIPTIDPAKKPEELPYCIWYPDVAEEDTYRQLARRYPQMRYQVARACAVAGYMTLYLELGDVLPEVAVAEEARDAGSDAIFTHIMSQPVRYRIMDDYYRTINTVGPQPGHLNGDTCVLSVVTRQKQEFWKPTDPDDLMAMVISTLGFDEMMYNITEDQGIEESIPETTSSPTSPPEELMVDLLTSPLPANLPAGNKDLLILTAAFYGNIDRYTRLRRPKALKSEIYCVIRGIYHNSLFALWWSRQREIPKDEPFHMGFWKRIQGAITARHIMNNDLSHVIARKDDKRSLPYVIWYPNIAGEATYKALAHRVPEMREACLRASIYADYRDLFDELLELPDVVPNPFLMVEAEKSGNPHFVSALQMRAKELGTNMDWISAVRLQQSHKLYSVKDPILVGTDCFLARSASVGLVSGEVCDDEGMYDGVRANIDTLELFLMAPEAWRPEKITVELDYTDWPIDW